MNNPLFNLIKYINWITHYRKKMYLSNIFIFIKASTFTLFQPIRTSQPNRKSRMPPKTRRSSSVAKPLVFRNQTFSGSTTENPFHSRHPTIEESLIRTALLLRDWIRKTLAIMVVTLLIPWVMSTRMFTSTFWVSWDYCMLALIVQLCVIYCASWFAWCDFIKY